MTVQIGQLYRKKIVRNLRGEIIDWVDETDGGVIVSKGRIINQERVDREARKEDDRREAALAQSKAIQAPAAVLEERTGQPGKFSQLEERVTGMESKMDKILELLTPKAPPAPKPKAK